MDAWGDLLSGAISALEVHDDTLRRSNVIVQKQRNMTEVYAQHKRRTDFIYIKFQYQIFVEDCKV